MTPIRFFTDEDVYGSVASKLREKGFDAVSTSEAHRLRESDASQLAWATQEGRVILTFNVADFGRLNSEWVNQRPIEFGEFLLGHVVAGIGYAEFELGAFWKSRRGLPYDSPVFDSHFQCLHIADGSPLDLAEQGRQKA